MKVSLRSVFVVVTLVAVFCAGWIGGGKHQEQISKAREAKALSKRQAVMLGHLNLLSTNPTSIEGVVTRTRGDLVVISLGTDDGMREGHEVRVFRGAKEIGSGIVTIAKHNKSVAKVQLIVDDQLVREGDYVTTKF